MSAPEFLLEWTVSPMIDGAHWGWGVWRGVCLLGYTLLLARIIVTRWWRSDFNSGHIHRLFACFLLTIRFSQSRPQRVVYVWPSLFDLCVSVGTHHIEHTFPFFLILDVLLSGSSIKWKISMMECVCILCSSPSYINIFKVNNRIDIRISWFVHSILVTREWESPFITSETPLLFPMFWQSTKVTPGSKYWSIFE